MNFNDQEKEVMLHCLELAIDKYKESYKTSDRLIYTQLIKLTFKLRREK